MRCMLCACLLTVERTPSFRRENIRKAVFFLRRRLSVVQGSDSIRPYASDLAVHENSPLCPGALTRRLSVSSALNSHAVKFTRRLIYTPPLSFLESASVQSVPRHFNNSRIALVFHDDRYGGGWMLGQTWELKSAFRKSYPDGNCVRGEKVAGHISCPRSEGGARFVCLGTFTGHTRWTKIHLKKRVRLAVIRDQGRLINAPCLTREPKTTTFHAVPVIVCSVYGSCASSVCPLLTHYALVSCPTSNYNTLKTKIDEQPLVSMKIEHQLRCT